MQRVLLKFAVNANVAVAVAGIDTADIVRAPQTAGL